MLNWLSWKRWKPIKILIKRWVTSKLNFCCVMIVSCTCKHFLTSTLVLCVVNVCILYVCEHLVSSVLPPLCVFWKFYSGCQACMAGTSTHCTVFLCTFPHLVLYCTLDLPETHYVVQLASNSKHPLPQSSKYWDCKCELTSPANSAFLSHFLHKYLIFDIMLD